VGRLIPTMLFLATCLLAPAAWAQTAGPTIAPSALDGKLHAAPAKKPAARVAKKRALRPAIRKAGPARAAHKAGTGAAGVRKAKAATAPQKPKGPARRAVTTELTVA